MPYLATKKIDGIDIVVGFTGPSIDPVATQKKVNALIDKTTEAADVDRLTAEKLDLDRQLDKCLMKARNPANRRRIVAGVQFDAGKKYRLEAQQLADQSNKKSDEIRALLQTIQRQAKALYESEPVYTGGGGYVDVDDETWDELKRKHSGLARGTLLCLDGSIIQDLRGKRYVAKVDDRWVPCQPQTLTDEVPDGAKLESELTDADRSEIMDQRAEDALRAMSDDDREKLKASKIEDSITQAALMKQGYELDGRDDPAGEARAWLQARKAEIEELYDVT
jgi:hypothetical protein